MDAVIPKHPALYPAMQFQVDEGITDDMVVVADRVGLQHVVENLLSNAGRFARSRVTIRAQSAAGITIVDGPPCHLPLARCRPGNRLTGDAGARASRGPAKDAPLMPLVLSCTGSPGELRQGASEAAWARTPRQGAADLRSYMSYV